MCLEAHDTRAASDAIPGGPRCPRVEGGSGSLDQHPPYAVLVADGRTARLFVVGLGEPLMTRQLDNASLARTSVGGWSQARYQRHVDHLRLEHAKEAAEALEQLVRREETLCQRATCIPIITRPRDANDRARTCFKNGKSAD